MKKLVIFDHDGLMVNSEQVVFAAMQQMFQKYTYNFTWAYYCTSIGLPVVDAITMYLRDTGIPLTFEEFYLERNERVHALMETELKPMAGLLELLAYLKARDVRMAVSTSGKRDYIQRNLSRYCITDYFSTLVCIDDVQRGKPHPDLFLKTLEVSETEAANAIVLEDSPHGIEAAHRAGIFCIAVPTRGINYQHFHKANLIADSLAEVQKILSFLDA
ncbi:HAD family hydrolase [Tengunoibacter tsumagoiensis]|uniref:Hydrolase n=1 Tax=Tengunoibacter tsumagoiensis TaxID=2014871 RepID=A0A402AAM7_9CHLR|nr:HAD family phosphatase [Tengunoibacter tsumagoiensis]GCE16096.1 hydrolase [Tengunoibacter tsumagoiensis]